MEEISSGPSASEKVKETDLDIDCKDLGETKDIQYMFDVSSEEIEK